VAATAAQFGPEWSASLRRGSDAELDGWLRFALDCADAADAIALRHFRHDVEISEKPDRTFVTHADRAIEELIRGRIADRFPDHGVVGEEFGGEDEHAALRWIVDPIDGTHNYMRGLPLFGLLLALERDGEIQVGVVSAPALGMRWWARRAGGAWARRAIGGDAETVRIAVSSVASVADAALLYGSAGPLIDGARSPGFTATVRSVWRERGIGDFWGYALVAEGAADAMVEVDFSLWDLAAPAVVVEEAGGRVTDLDGIRRFDAGSVLASNGRLHEDLLERLAAG
jgi:histidinol-phosphatase